MNVRLFKRYFLCRFQPLSSNYGSVFGCGASARLRRAAPACCSIEISMGIIRLAVDAHCPSTLHDTSYYIVVDCVVIKT